MRFSLYRGPAFSCFLNLHVTLLYCSSKTKSLDDHCLDLLCASPGSPYTEARPFCMFIDVDATLLDCSLQIGYLDDHCLDSLCASPGTPYGEALLSGVLIYFYTMMSNLALTRQYLGNNHITSVHYYFVSSFTNIQRY